MPSHLSFESVDLLAQSDKLIRKNVQGGSYHVSPRPPCTMVPGAEAIHLIKLNDVDPRAWLADVLRRLPDHPAKRIHELLPWNWSPEIATARAA